MTVLGVDIGGTAIKYAPVRDGHLAAPVRRLPTPKNRNALLNTVSDLITREREEWEPAAAGVGIPGFIRSRDQVIVRSPNLLFLNGMAFGSELARISPIPTTVDNDANCAALGAWSRVDPRPDCLVHLTLGTGIGSGIIFRGRPWRGACGFAAELGHTVVHPEGRPCGCGGRGCAETEASESGILNTFRELRPGSHMTSSRELHEKMLAGDADARGAFHRAGRYLGILLTNIVNTLNPDIITMSGGITAAGDALLDPAREEMKIHLHSDALACTRIAISDYRDTGVLGAGLLAHKDLPL